MSELLQIRNDGPKIVECNFWTLLNTGKFFVSVNAAAFRILIFTEASFAVRQVLLVCQERSCQESTENPGLNVSIPGSRK